MHIRGATKQCRFNSWLVAACLILSAGMSTGCASYGAAFLSSLPPGAEVISLDDDTLLCTTPDCVSWRSDIRGPKMISVRFQKPGYADKVTAFTVDIGYRFKSSAMENAKKVKVELEEKR